MVELKIKVDKAVGAVMPFKANPTDSGYDLTATSIRYDDEYGFIEYGTGIYLDIPAGYDVKLYARSSNSKYDLWLCNGVAVIDESYKRELLLRFKVSFDYDCATLMAEELKTYDTTNRTVPHIRYARIYKVGDRIAQMILEKKEQYELVPVEDVEDSGRGGFGSSDYSSYVNKDLVEHVTNLAKKNG